MIDDRRITPDTMATLLLTGIFPGGEASPQRPLTLSEYNQLVRWLIESRLRPADLVENPSLVEDSALAPPVAPERLNFLMKRGVALAFALEKWSRIGLWVIGRGDPDYPGRLKERLRGNAPAVLYGVGDRKLLGNGGVAIVGSRDATPTALQFTAIFGAACARHSLQVVSGGARGVDREAMLAAAATGGAVIGVLADSLEKEALTGKYRDLIRTGQLLLVSPFVPHARFQVGTAMARNKFIYTLSDCAMVVSSDFERGGTWAGAVENLQHKWVPLAVRAGDDVPRGNRELLKLGAIAVHDVDLDPQFDPSRLKQTTPTVELAQQPLSAQVAPPQDTKNETPVESDQGVNVQEVGRTPFDIAWGYLVPLLRAGASEQELASRLDVAIPQVKDWLAQAAQLHWVERRQHPVRYWLYADAPVSGAVDCHDLAEQMWPLIETQLQRIHTDVEVAETLCLKRAQVKRWLDWAVQQGKAKRFAKPVRYFAASVSGGSSREAANLFDELDEHAD